MLSNMELKLQFLITSYLVLIIFSYHTAMGFSCTSIFMLMYHPRVVLKKLCYYCINLDEQLNLILAH